MISTFLIYLSMTLAAIDQQAFEGPISVGAKFPITIGIVINLFTLNLCVVIALILTPLLRLVNRGN